MLERLLKNLLKIPGIAESAEVVQGPLYPAVREALLEVQSYAKSHGGRIELVSVSEEGEVVVKFEGACRGCPVADITFKLGIEQQLQALVPGVRKVTRAR